MEIKNTIRKIINVIIVILGFLFHILIRLYRGSIAFIKEVIKPVSFVKGDIFENYVRKKIFTISDYQLIYRTPEYWANRKDYVQSSLYPDFWFKDRRSRVEFFVEVKWRNGNYWNGKINWCNPQQLKRYKEIDKDTLKVFIILGIGNKPSRPDRIALFPVSECDYNELYDSFIEKYLIKNKRAIDYSFIKEYFNSNER